MRTNGRKEPPVWQHQPDVQIETVVCSFDTRSTSTWKFAEKECWLGAISESSPCEKGWISVLLHFFNLGLQVLLLSAQRIENTYSSLPAGGSCNLASQTRGFMVFQKCLVAFAFWRSCTKPQHESPLVVVCKGPISRCGE